jgi:DNA-cytosine methyltransferase
VKVGGLFSGIGGWELGLERAGFEIAWHCEADPFCRRVLEHHWPGVPCYDDVRTLRGCDVEPVDVLCGGFPCQDLSLAGKGAGLDGARSGLWSEFARLIGELRPRYVLVENVSALLGRGLGRVLGDLAALGYDAEWDCLPASAFGAPHRRDRIWIVAYPCGAGRRQDARGAHGDEAPHEGRNERKTITSLAVLARNDFRQADGRVVWPTPRATDADKGGRGDLLAMRAHALGGPRGASSCSCLLPKGHPVQRQDDADSPRSPSSTC